MRLDWVSATTLSSLRMVQGVHAANHLHRGNSFGDEALAAMLAKPAASIHERLVSESIHPQRFWESLLDEVIADDDDVPLTAALVEIAVLRAGGSQLQSDQTAAILHRHLQASSQTIASKFPRQAEQLKLRYAPMKQAYQAYGPGLIRSIGRRIWDGDPPADWWPNQITVHAVSPMARGAGDISGTAPALWVEAVLTDMHPDVPEWLRLVYLITRVAINTHTRTHLSSGPVDLSGPDPSVRELPWQWGIIPLVLAQAQQNGLLSVETLPIELATTMWHGGDHDRFDTTEVALLETWWTDIGCHAKALPPALKQLSVMLSSLDTGNASNSSRS